MNTRGKMTAIMLACGLIPIALVSVTTFLTARDSLQQIKRHASSGLRKSIETSLVSTRDLKAAQIQQYFQTVNRQVVTFSEDRMIVDAMRGVAESLLELSKGCQARARRHHSVS